MAVLVPHAGIALGCEAGADEEAKDPTDAPAQEKDAKLQRSPDAATPGDEVVESDPSTASTAMSDGSDSEASDSGSDTSQEVFSTAETVLIFDWDDTMLPSTWVQLQGLCLDAECVPTEWQQEQLNRLAEHAEETLRVAKRCGTVVLVTNAERGWIELSCQKFMPRLYPSLEDVKLLSARTTYETPDQPSPLEWKACAFASEIERIFGADVIQCADHRKNVMSLGDSVHEREALLRATAALPNCRSKSLKFVERPEVEQLRMEHSLVAGCLRRLVHHDGNLDLCVRCAANGP